MCVCIPYEFVMLLMVEDLAYSIHSLRSFTMWIQILSNCSNLHSSSLNTCWYVQCVVCVHACVCGGCKLLYHMCSVYM